MGLYHLKLPKMGESVAEATVTKWLLDIGDKIQQDDPIVEIATDKVDTDVTSEVEGILVEKCFNENEVVKVGETLVIIETEGAVEQETEIEIPEEKTAEEPSISIQVKEEETPPLEETAKVLEQDLEKATTLKQVPISEGSRFYSPLVRNIAKKEGIP
ncbi:MAG: biotin/lipoyl-containing protein, partial [Flavobacteriaceae bacterium]